MMTAPVSLFPPRVPQDPAPFLFLSAEHKAKNASKPYDPKRSCWVPDADAKFVEGLIQETNGGKIKVQILKDKSVRTNMISTSTCKAMPFRLN